MDRIIRFHSLIALLIYGSIPFCSAQNQTPIPQQAAYGGNVHATQGIAPARPPVETAGLEGIIPGLTTEDQLTQIWGDPMRESFAGDQVRRLYSRDPLDHIEVILRGGIVRSIAVQFDTPFPEEDVRSSLQEELLWSKPVVIPDENGGFLGEVFPERGVMFSFAPQEEGGGCLVERIGIEPISADPFVIRAEAILHNQPTEAKQDLMDAIRLQPDHAKAYWLLAQIELWEGSVESALLNNEKAIQLDKQRLAYHLTFAQAMMQMNRIEEAKQYLQETLRVSDRFPHEKARALLMLGELYRISRQPDIELAYLCVTEAIQIATALLNHSNQTMRLTAKDVLFNAHLETAKIIARGRWDQKERLQHWIDRAKVLASDTELLKAPRYSREYQFKIAACTLSTLVAIPEKLNIDIDIEDVIIAGNGLIQSTNDPILRAKYHWDTSTALYDAVQIFQLRRQYASALKYGELAAHYMETGMKTRNNKTDKFLLGRLYFRLGSIHAIGNENHRAAIEWYDLARPIFEELLPLIDTEALGRFGEQLVSMGVSYWEAGKQAEAVELTETGRRLIERGVRAKMMPESAQSTPYSNLAKMYQGLGDQDNAMKYLRLAASVGNVEESKVR